MTETLIRIERSTHKGKKYMAIVRSATGSERKVHFGAIDYEQYRDSTPLKLYKSKNHMDGRRRMLYFSRHSGVRTKAAALRKEIKKSGGVYTPKILSHRYLW